MPSTSDRRPEVSHPHTHVDSHGVVFKCLHKCKSAVADTGFWVGMTLEFPLEHYLYEKIWPFTIVTHWLGL